MVTSDTSITQERENQGAVCRFMTEAFGGGNLSLVDEMVSSDFIQHQPGMRSGDREGVKRLIGYLHQALPDLTYTFEDMVASGDKVWARVHAHGTHLGTFMGVASTGRAITVELIEINRFQDGKMVEHWGITDRLATMEQLGKGQE